MAKKTKSKTKAVPGPVVQVTFSDGSRWTFPAHVIADNRATYYAGRDGDTTYEAEYEYAINDDYELTDWALNNMNWEDVETSATRAVDPLPIDYEDEWCNADIQINRKS